MQRITHALSYAWRERQMVHRDLKPSNIRLTAGGEPRLLEQTRVHRQTPDVGTHRPVAGHTHLQTTVAHDIRDVALLARQPVLLGAGGRCLVSPLARAVARLPPRVGLALSRRLHLGKRHRLGRTCRGDLRKRLLRRWHAGAEADRRGADQEAGRHQPEQPGATRLKGVGRLDTRHPILRTSPGSAPALRRDSSLWSGPTRSPPPRCCPEAATRPPPTVS